MPGPIDKAVTIQAASASIHTIQFTRLDDVAKSIRATAHGSVDVSDGTSSSEQVSWILSGAAETTVRNFMDGAALTRWRTAKGIEAP